MLPERSAATGKTVSLPGKPIEPFAMFYFGRKETERFQHFTDFFRENLRCKWFFCRKENSFFLASHLGAIHVVGVAGHIQHAQIGINAR